jgi:leader peptidase (prepilin peptidase)/N-methyltransferase
MNRMFDAEVWASVPFHFWSVTLFVFGTMVGSLLNVCIHRMPLGQSIVHPPSHCPHCKYSIPWYLNVPLFTWLYLRGKCANCQSPISIRYFLVELLTGVTFLACWLNFGHQSPALALCYCLILAGFIAATFIDFEHFIIPDEITIGGIVAGFLCSAAVPALHVVTERPASLRASFLGIAVGGGIVYLILRGGKMLFGKQRIDLEPDSRLVFTETSLKLPEKEVPYEELFYRKSDAIILEAKTIELPDRCYWNQTVKLTPELLTIGEQSFKPEEVPHMEVVTSGVVLPREAMGLGDVKFMAAIGAFLGWQAVIFSLMFSAVLGSIVGVSAIVLHRKEWSSRVPYGPYIAAAATVWIFLSPALQSAWVSYLAIFGEIFHSAAPPNMMGR